MHFLSLTYRDLKKNKTVSNRLKADNTSVVSAFRFRTASIKAAVVVYSGLHLVKYWIQIVTFGYLIQPASGRIESCPHETNDPDVFVLVFIIGVR